MAALGRRLGRAVPGRRWRSRSCSRWSAPRRRRRPRPVPPDVLPLDGAALGVLAGVAAGHGARAAARALPGRAARTRAWPGPERPAPAVALALVATVAALLLWLANPYAGLLAVPAAHLWLLVLLHGVQPNRRVRARAARARGAARAAGGRLLHVRAVDRTRSSAAWYLLLLVTGHTVGLLTALVGCVMLGALCAAAELVYRSPRRRPRSRRGRGPRALGPGFALRR